MPVRMLRREEYLEFEKVQSVAFVFPLDVAEREKKLKEEPEPENAARIGCFDEDNTLMACMALPEFDMRYEGGFVKMIGIGGVASLPEYRFGGAIRRIFEVVLRKAYDENAVFTSLYPFSHPYYRKFGYELCQATSEYDVPIEALKNFRFTGKARMFQSGDSLEPYKELFEKHFFRYNLAIRRGEDNWKRWASSDPYKDRVYRYLLEDENGPIAYLVFSAQNGPEPWIKYANVHELAIARPDALSGVLGFVYRLAAQYEKARFSLPDDIPLMSMLDESHVANARFQNQHMTRVVNVRRALELKRHPAGCAYTLRVNDDGIAENDGVFAVRADEGGVRVEKLDGDKDIKADLTCDVRTLTQLLVGFLSIDGAMYKKDVRVAGALDALRAVYVRREVYLTDHF